LIRSDKFK